MEKIDFEDIRVGDVVEVRMTHDSGDVVTWRGTVTRRSSDRFETQMFTFARSSNYSYDYFLVERPKPTFKVGDTITGEQVADLPDGAVFDLYTGFGYLRYKINGQVYSERGFVISLDTYGESDYRDIKIVFLPEA